MDPQRPSFMITGTGVPGRLAAQVAYGGFWLSVGSDAIRMPLGGIGPLIASYPAVEKELTRRIEAANQPALVAGHSQGGYHALWFALEHPEYVHSAMAVSTPFSGLDVTLRNYRLWLKHRGGRLGWLVNDVWFALEHPVKKIVERLAPSLHSLAFLTEDAMRLRDRVEREWPAGVRLALVGSTGDQLVQTTTEQHTAFDLTTPQGDPDRYCLFLGDVEPDIGLADVHYVKAERRAGHLSMVAEPMLYRLLMRYSYPPAIPIEPVEAPIPTPAA